VVQAQNPEANPEWKETISTEDIRSERKEVSQERKLPDNPKEIMERQSKRMLWSTESNAELTSNRARIVTLELSIAE